MSDPFSPLQSPLTPAPPKDARSAIEARFPHIAKELCALWETDQIELYMDKLLLDSRGGRQGFQNDVLDELMFLSDMRWHLRRQAGRLVSQERVDVFSFSAMNENELRQARSKNAWVLE
jgi:hypothetical protein